MEANELRIGNWVECHVFKFFDDGTPNERPFKIENGQDIDRAPALSPLSITHEILTKAGFEHYLDMGRPTGNWDKIPLCGFTWIERGAVMVIHPGNSVSHVLRPKIEHVHQLQNLYFALYGEELNIDL